MELIATRSNIVSHEKDKENYEKKTYLLVHAFKVQPETLRGSIKVFVIREQSVYRRLSISNLFLLTRALVCI